MDCYNYNCPFRFNQLPNVRSDNWCNRTGFVQRNDDFCSYGKPKMSGDVENVRIKNV